MVHGRERGTQFLISLLAGMLLLAFSVDSTAQQPPSSPRRESSSQPMDSSATVVVSVRESSGMPLPDGAFVKLYSNFSGVHLTEATRDGSTATFPSIQGGEYEIEVSSVGYKTAVEHASVMAGGSRYPIFIYMHSESEVAPETPKGGAPIMAPRLQTEIDKGLDKMKHQQYDAARTHFEKAATMAPGNPDIQFLLGMVEYLQQRFDAARVKFEAAVAIYPAHERSLVALGELFVRLRQPTQAADVLERAYRINGADWRTHLLLAQAYGAKGEYEKAAAHAARAADLGKEAGAMAKLLLGRIRASQGRTVEARAMFENIIRDFPTDAAVRDAKSELAALDKRIAAAKADMEKREPTADPPAALLPVLPLLVRAWAPPDVDAKEYPVVADVTCAAHDLLERTQRRGAKQLANFERFVATERVEHQEIDANGNPGPMRVRDFNYLVFIQRPKQGSVYLEEERDGGQNLAAFPTSLASTGLVGLGVQLFDPQYVNDFMYTCEGLGQWRAQPAWQIRFEQRKEMESHIRTWRNGHGLFSVPLKGRVWVAANSYDVLHIETDLREPQALLELNRDHLVIDYGPVQFEKGKTSLWLPWYAELFMELHGKRYHHRHTLTNYALFSVDTTHSVSAPKEN
jgi:tetratricopeptide (TPR) repeat protein